ncbi:hypothetical protein J4440_00795 [Candidatus Woesearchaeota archaeon]|nr:hypothetical protein [Candidatus Woesearchaeota archaeon]
MEEIIKRTVDNYFRNLFKQYKRLPQFVASGNGDESTLDGIFGYELIGSLKNSNLEVNREGLITAFGSGFERLFMYKRDLDPRFATVAVPILSGFIARSALLNSMLNYEIPIINQPILAEDVVNLANAGLQNNDIVMDTGTVLDEKVFDDLRIMKTASNLVSFVESHNDTYEVADVKNLAAETNIDSKIFDSMEGRLTGHNIQVAARHGDARKYLDKLSIFSPDEVSYVNGLFVSSVDPNYKIDIDEVRNFIFNKVREMNTLPLKEYTTEIRNFFSGLSNGLSYREDLCNLFGNMHSAVSKNYNKSITEAGLFADNVIDPIKIQSKDNKVQKALKLREFYVGIECLFRSLDGQRKIGETLSFGSYQI